MFKSARWRSDKNKVKVVFKLQFHATQLSKFGGDALTISVVPADTGKPTVKSDKAIVIDASCFWANPLYETVKFSRDPKSRKIHERIYYFVVGTGASKGVVGEASIDFSNYAETTKVSSLSCPLEKSQSEVMLYVSIQRIQEPDDQRDVEESEKAKLYLKEQSLSELFGNAVDGTVKSNSFEDMNFNKVIGGVSEVNVNHRASSESDVTLLGSESSSGHETPWEPRVKNHNIRYRSAESLSLRSLGPKSDVQTAVFEEHKKSRWEWLGNSAVEASTDDSSGTPRETYARQHSDVASDILVNNLKHEVTVLSRQLEMSELELQTLRKQVVKESKRGQDLLREIASLKEEKDALKEECTEFKVCERPLEDANTKMYMQLEMGDSQELVEELRQELNHAKELNANHQIQLRKMQESNSELILAVQDLEEVLKQKNQEIFNLSDKSLLLLAVNKNSHKLDSTCETYDEEQKVLEELVREQNGVKEEYFLKQQMMDLHGEIEIYRRDKNEQEMQLEQLALDYEIMKQENHELLYKLEQSQIQEQLKIQYECSTSYATVQELEYQIENLENELKKRSKEFVDSLVTINELEAYAKSLEEELENQAQRFEADLGTLMRSKVEEEQRAIRAEESLRKTRCQNANTAERLQEEFRRLSVQMSSTFEANEKVANKAIAEANELRLQKNHLEEMIRNNSEENKSMKGYYEVRLHQLSNNMVIKSNEIEQMQSVIKDMAGQMEHQKTKAKEDQRLLSDEILMLKDESEKMRKSVQEIELCVEKENSERFELESSVILRMNETEELQKYLNNTKRLLEEKEVLVVNLQSDLNFLQSQYDELKHSLSKDSLEKDKLRKQVLQLKSDLKKREDAHNRIEKNFKDSNGRGTTLDVMKANSKSGKSIPLPRANKEMENLKERIKMLEIVAAVENQAPSFKLIKESINSDGNLKPAVNIFRINDCDMLSTDCNSVNTLEALKDSARNIGDGEKMEMAYLKERNNAVEEELKEMQGRYSEISLKLAEVEGEKQQLAIKVRNLKNARKSL